MLFQFSVPEDCSPLVKEVRPLSMKKLSTLFLLLFCLGILALIILAFEHYYYKRAPKSISKTEAKTKELMAMGETLRAALITFK